MAKLRVTRTLVIEGEEEWVRATCDSSLTLVHPDKPFEASRGTITETSRVEEKLNG